MYKLKVRLDSGDEFFLRVDIHSRTEDGVKWLMENMGYSRESAETYWVFEKEYTLEKATGLDWFKVAEYLPAAYVLYSFKSLEIIRSDEGDNV